MKKFALSIAFVLSLFNIAIAAEKQLIPEDVKALVSQVSLADVLSKDNNRIFRNIPKSQLDKVYASLKDKFKPENLLEMQDYISLTNDPKVTHVLCKIFASDNFSSLPEQIIDKEVSDYKSQIGKLSVKVEFVVHEYPKLILDLAQVKPQEAVSYEILNGLWKFKTMGLLPKNKIISKCFEVNSEQFLQDIEYTVVYLLHSNSNAWNFPWALSECSKGIRETVNANNQKITISIILGRRQNCMLCYPETCKFI